ncbi:J-domain-containing protein [Microbacterium sp. ZOR0019]|uniref:DnaJ family domain-containing protein n=1 Tax=Microbacterium sp. ZOR0019 TaxID=1339233 RepID=UPI00068970C5|nr:DUF1992 domain-containing protein [Microbacterium sp. ZOR0019]
MHDAEEDEGDTAGAGGPPRWSTTEERWAAVELNIQMAIRRGEFDDLPGAGKPIENLGRTHDPDWWIRQKIERENLTGLAPPVFQLRTEDANLRAVLDTYSQEEDVRRHVEDFNSRIRAARMQLTGGPPVVTPLRDVDAEVDEWRRRRRKPDGANAPTPSTPEAPRRRWWRRSST